MTGADAQCLLCMTGKRTRDDTPERNPSTLSGCLRTANCSSLLRWRRILWLLVERLTRHLISRPVSERDRWRR